MARTGEKPSERGHALRHPPSRALPLRRREGARARRAPTRAMVRQAARPEGAALALLPGGPAPLAGVVGPPLPEPRRRRVRVRQERAPRGRAPPLGLRL